MKRPWMRDLLANPDGVAALTRFLENASAVIERVSPLYEVVRAAAADPEVAELLDRNKKERREGFGAVVRSSRDSPPRCRSRRPPVSCTRSKARRPTRSSCATSAGPLSGGVSGSSTPSHLNSSRSRRPRSRA